MEKADSQFLGGDPAQKHVDPFIFEQGKRDGSRHFVTGDESWFVLSDSPTKM
jgi:hypothetical protein